MIYVVMVSSIVSGIVRVSQESYSTLQAAQRFCESRSREISKFGQYKYADRNYVYTIFEVTVKK